MIQKRIAFIQETVNGYSSLEDYARDKDEWLAVRGIALSLMNDCISLCNYIEYNDYENYYIVPTADGGLAVSHVILWHDPCCANNVLKENADEEDILTAY